MTLPAADPLIRYEAAGVRSAGAPFGFDVRPGEMTVLTGPPGTGKSSILRSLAGRPSGPPDRALLGGRSLADLSHRRRRARLRELRLGYVPEIPALLSNITVMENLLLPARFLGEIPVEKAWQEALLLLDASGLGWCAGRLPGALSPEEQRAVAVIRALLRRPRVALLDEPLAGLDAACLAGVRSLMRATLGRGECAMLATAADASPYSGVRCRLLSLPGRRDAPGGEG